MSEQISLGRTVMLKSGGPVMTVDTIGDHYGTMTAWCSWFYGKKLTNGTFPITSLQVYD